jgi:hypothetical protein
MKAKTKPKRRAARKILPCPFCGAEADLGMYCGYIGYVSCGNILCCACGPDGKGPEDGIRKWNRRIPTGKAR